MAFTPGLDELTPGDDPVKELALLRVEVQHMEAVRRDDLRNFARRIRDITEAFRETEERAKRNEQKAIADAIRMEQERDAAVRHFDELKIWMEDNQITSLRKQNAHNAKWKRIWQERAKATTKKMREDAKRWAVRVQKLREQLARERSRLSVRK
jgi:hypothetical protein